MPSYHQTVYRTGRTLQSIIVNNDIIWEERRLTKTNSADMRSIFSDVEQTDCFYHEVDDKLPVVDAWKTAAPYTTGTVDYE